MKCWSCNSELPNGTEYCLFCSAIQPGHKTSGGKVEEMDTGTADQEETNKGSERRREAVPKKMEEVKEQQRIITREEQRKARREKEKQEREELEYIAYHDELTGVLNRQAYERNLKKYDKNEVAVIYIDANHLKVVNDNYGHKYGDQLLIIIADAIKIAFGVEDSYRMGGDEFCIVLQGEKEKSIQPKIKKFNEALEARRIEYFEKNAEVEKFPISAAIGTAFSDHKKSVQDLVDQADSDMFEKKKKMGGVREADKCQFFPDGTYNANFDGYYDDVEAKVEIEEKKFKKEQVFKSAFLIAIFVVLVILYEIFL